MKFNVNDKVRVKLTQRGLDILKEQHEKLCETFPKIGPWKHPRTDALGYTEYQLWALMETFGPHIQLGMQVPFETDILIGE